VKRQIAMLLVYLLLIATCGCSTSDASENENDHASVSQRTYTHAEYTSKATKENCYLCSDNPESELSRYFGHKNLGIVNVNTFDVVELEINRYDHNGDQIQEAAGAMRTGLVDIGGISFACRSDPDRSLASASFTHEGEKIDEKKISSYLCQKCLDAFTEQYILEDVISPIAIVDFSDRTLTPLQKTCTGFAHADYLVHIDFESSPN
jgi:hypothetical protein